MRSDSFDFIVPTVWSYSVCDAGVSIGKKVERLVRQIPIADEDALGDFREDYSKGIDRNFTGYSGYYHGVSPGASENNLMNYYYSQDTREFFLREEEQAHVNKKNSKKLTNNKQ